MNLYITPHPPIILDKIGNGDEKKAGITIEGMQSIATDIAKNKPKTIAIITPHGNVFGDALCIHVEDNLTGSFAKFGHPKLSYNFKNNTEKAREICVALAQNNINNLSLNKETASQYDISTDLDHGVLVPLDFIMKQYVDFNMIHISIGFLSKTELYKAGQIISNILGEDNVLIVSGDLSHRLKKGSSNGYDKMGEVYDEHIVDAIKNTDYIKILSIDEEMLHRAGQCAQKPLELFIGALEGYKTQSTVYSYEGPFGVGYMTAKISRGEKTKDSVLATYLESKEQHFNNTTKDEDAYITLARNTIQQYIADGIKNDLPEDLLDEFYNNQNGVFVSIKKEGRLRGCIGTIEPTKKHIAQEIIDNAISAAVSDPRFPPIEAHELQDLQISVDILFPSEDIKSKADLDVKEYGVIVSRGYKRGLLLPNLEGVDTIDDQVSIALQKAGIKENEDYSMQRFKVVRHK